MMQWLFFIFIIFYSACSYSKSLSTDALNQDQLIKAFYDICYLNRKQMNKISDLSVPLKWKKSKSKEMYGVKKYTYNNYTIILKSDLEEELCIIGMNNNNKYYGFELAKILLAKFHPSGKVIEDSYGLHKNIETDYGKSWYIEGGYKIEVALIDFEYRKVNTNPKRYVSIQLSRF